MEIKICPQCKGMGVIRHNVGIHENEYEWCSCINCNGTGRIKTDSFSYSVPFDTENEEIYKTNAEIIRLIRELESKK